jgi:hypothetical protein
MRTRLAASVSIDDRHRLQVREIEGSCRSESSPLLLPIYGKLLIKTTSVNPKSVVVPFCSPNAGSSFHDVFTYDI